MANHSLRTLLQGFDKPAPPCYNASMKHMGGMLVLFLWLASGLGGQAEPELGFFEEEVQHLALKTFALPLDHRGSTVNCYLVWLADTQQALVIDPGVPAPALLEFIRSQGLQVLAILNTHGHYDHVGGIAFLAEKLAVPAYLHRADRSLAAETVGAKFPFTFYPDQPKLILGGFEVEVLHTPGHSPGSVCLRIGDILFSGDTLFAGGIGKAHGNSSSRRQAALRLEVNNIRRRLLPLPPLTRVFPGHGPSTTIGVEKRSNPFLD
jgi:glyoxylase-like metal-dependent hydrolase (beta-lactamase superfamily II)